MTFSKKVGKAVFYQGFIRVLLSQLCGYRVWWHLVDFIAEVNREQ